MNKSSPKQISPKVPVMEKKRIPFIVQPTIFEMNANFSRYGNMSLNATKNAKEQWAINKEQKTKSPLDDQISSDKNDLTKTYHDKQLLQMDRINKMITDNESRHSKATMNKSMNRRIQVGQLDNGASQINSSKIQSPMP